MIRPVIFSSFLAQVACFASVGNRLDQVRLAQPDAAIYKEGIIGVPLGNRSMELRPVERLSEFNGFHLAVRPKVLGG